MIKGLYSAASGMVAVESRMDVIANNLANASTPGFRRQTSVQTGFDDVFLDRLRHPFHLNVRRGPGGGARFSQTVTDTRAGGFTQTGNPLHVALEGPAYLAVMTPEGERYTRNGAFTVDVDGDLSTVDGHKVLSDAGPLPVDAGPVVIDSEGFVYSNGALAGQLRLVEFEDPHALERRGEHLYFAPDEALDTAAPALETRVQQSALEQSNVQVTREMVDMTLALRAYEANQRVIHAVDGTVGRLIEQVATPS